MTETTTSGLLVVPANNSTMQLEMDALCPHLAPFTVARVQRPPRTLVFDDLPAYADSTMAAVAPMLWRHHSHVVYGCTAAGFLGGPDGNRRMTDALRNQTGATVVSTADAMIQVLRHEGVREVAVVTPYLPEVNDGLRSYLTSEGIAVEVLNSFMCETTDALGRITQEQVKDLALRTVTPHSKALFVACSQLPTMDIISDLRTRLGIPVWSSITATAWAASRAQGTIQPGVAA